MFAVLNAESFDAACVKNQRNAEGAPFREALSRLMQTVVEQDNTLLIRIDGSEMDVATVEKEIHPAPKPGKAPISQKAQIKENAAANAAKKKTPGVIAREQREQRQKAEKAATKAPRAAKEKKAPAAKREKVFEGGKEMWACSCGNKVEATHKAYTNGWRLPRGSATPICPTCRGVTLKDTAEVKTA